MGGLFFAWAVGEGIVTWRWVKLKAPPTPGVLLLSSGLFIALAAVAEYQPARTFATVTAWGLDLAILLQVLGKAPQGKTGWPPPFIDNPATVFPQGRAADAAQGQAAQQAVTNQNAIQKALNDLLTGNLTPADKKILQQGKS